MARASSAINHNTGLRTSHDNFGTVHHSAQPKSLAQQNSLAQLGQPTIASEDDFWLQLRQFHVTNHIVRGRKASIMDAFAVAKRAKQAEEELVDHGSKANKKNSISMDKKSIDPEILQKTDCIRVFNPKNKYKIAWDLFLAAIIFYSVLSIPYKIGFGIEYEMFFGSADGAADLIMDVLFLLDIFATFNTGYTYQNKYLVTNRRLIVKNYLKGWFIIDFLSTVPIDNIAQLAMGPEGSDAKNLRTLKMIRGLRLPRLLKLARLLKLKKITAILEESGMFNPALFKLFGLLLQILFIAHMLACGWYYMNEATEFGWSHQFGIVNDHILDRYLKSLYWTIATMMAVGYGDIYATNNTERIYSIFAQIVGAFMFGLIIGTVQTVMETADARATIAKRELDDVVEYCRNRKLPKGLSKQVKAHFEYALSVRSMFDERGILGRLPVLLRQRVINHSKKEMIEAIPLLRDYPKGFVNLLLTELSPYLATPGTVLWLENGHARELYIVRKGLIEFRKSLGEAVKNIEKKEDTVIAINTDSSFVGGQDIPLDCSYLAKVARVSDLFMISTDDLHDLFHMFPIAEEKFHRSQITRNNKLREIVKELTSEILNTNKPGVVKKKILSASLSRSKTEPRRRSSLTGEMALASTVTRSVLSNGRIDNDWPILHNFKRKSRAMLIGDWPPDISTSKKEKYRVIKANVSREKWEAKNRLADIQRRGSLARLRSKSSSSSAFDGDEEDAHPKKRYYTPTITVEEDEDTLWDRYIIFPQRMEKMQWDLIMALLIFYSVVIIPYRICFEVNESNGERALDIIIDIAFFTDMAFTFRTAYYDSVEKAFVSIPHKIRNNYLQTWFTIDFLSTVPIDTIVTEILTAGKDGASEGDVKSRVRLVKLIRGLRLIRLLKLARLLKLGKFMKNVEDYVTISPAAIRMIKLLLQVTLIAHMFACIWFQMSAVETFSFDGRTEDQSKWWSAVGIWNGDLAPGASQEQISQALGEKYVASIYWAFTTMTTVGYGDVTPQRRSEIIFSIIAMVLGATIFGFIVGNVSAMVGKIDVGAARLREQMTMIKDYMREQELPREMRMEVETFFEYYFSRKSVFDERKILHDLPPFLRKKVILFINRDIVKKLALFHDPIMSDDLSCSILQAMQPSFILKDELVYKTGDPGTELYFIVEGGINLILTDFKGRIEENVESGGSFGGLEFIMGTPRNTDAVANAYTTVMYVTHTAIDFILEHLPDVARNLQFLLSKYVTLSFSKELRDRMHSTNVLRLSAGMNRSLIAKFGRKKMKSESNLLAKKVTSETQDDTPQRVQSTGNVRPSLGNIDTKVKSTGEAVLSPKANILGMRKRRRGKESPGQKPLKVENTKFKTRKTGSLGGDATRRRRRTRRHSPKRRSISVTDNVEIDASFKEALEHAKNEPRKENNRRNKDVEEEYDTELLLPDMPSDSDDSRVDGEVSDLLEKKTSASPTNKYAVTVVSDVLKSTTANVHEILRQRQKDVKDKNLPKRGDSNMSGSNKYAIEMVDTAEHQ